MDDDVREELARLRARAYGPDADIGGDPAALARLDELEDQDRRQRSTVPDASLSRSASASTTAVPVDPRSSEPSDPRASADGERGGDETDPAFPAVDADAAEGARVDGTLDAGDARGDADALDAGGARGSEPEASTSSFFRRLLRRRPPVRSQRSLWLWAGTVAVVAAVASAATAVGTTFAPVSRSAGVAQVDTLQIDPSFVPPPLFWPTPDGVTGYRDFFGMTAVVGSLRVYSDDSENTCLYLVPSEDIADTDSSYRGGQVYGGCGAGVFAPTAQLVVSDDQPAALRERFPVGTSLQFVLDGERIGVFSDAE